MLEEIDDTVGEIAGRRRGRDGNASEYELVVLSDHGQVETVAFNGPAGRTLGEIVAEHLPTHEVAEYKGQVRQPKGDALDGHVALTYSGGLPIFTSRTFRVACWQPSWTVASPAWWRPSPGSTG